MKKQILKNKNGITLIALVVTIVVLLILAGVSISMLTGENGIINQSKEAKNQTEIADVKEQAKLDIISWRVEQITNGKIGILDDSTVKTILTDKEYVETLGDTSFITKKGYEILYSELYTSLPGVDEEIIPDGMVARINTNYYSTLQDAIDSVPDNIETEIILLTDITEAISVNSGKNIILDLNNKKISNSLKDVVTIEGDSNITINNGTIEVEENYAGYRAIYNNGGKIVLSNIVADGLGYSNAIEITSGSVEINSGIIKSDYTGISIGKNGQCVLNGEIEIEMTDLYGFTYPITNSGHLTINKGTILTITVDGEEIEYTPSERNCD